MLRSCVCTSCVRGGSRFRSFLSNTQDHTTWQLILQSEQLTCWLSPRTNAECQVLNVAAAAQAVSEGDISEMDFPGIQGGQESSRAGYNQVNSTVLADHC